MFNLELLKEEVSYELWILEYIRKKLYNQMEGEVDKIKIIFDDRLSDGNLKMNILLTGSISLSENAVKKTLNLMRPLSFSSAFKIQDMVIDWILNENNFRKDYRFKQKIGRFEDIEKSDNFLLPKFFENNLNILKAFFHLYKNLEPLRGSIVHTGEFFISEDGNINIKDRERKNYIFTNQEQAYYIRFVCVLTKMLLNDLKNESYYIGLIENDLFNLKRYHFLNTIKPKDVFYTKVELIIPKEKALSLSPFKVKINIPEIAQSVATRYTTTSNKKVYFSLNIKSELDDRILQWNFPAEDIPFDIITLTEADPPFAKYFSVEMKGR